MEYLKNGIKLLFVALLVITTACGSSNSTKQSNTDKGTDGNEYMTLEDHLRRINGVQVMGSGGNAKVVLRTRGMSNASKGVTPQTKWDTGMRDDNNERQPLFVLDGQKMGRDYPTVRDLISVGNIKSVRLLRDSEASQYGSESGFGVIEIITNSRMSDKN